MTGQPITRLAMGALALVVTMLAFGWSSSGSTQTAQAQADPVGIIQDFIDTFNAGDAAGAAAHFTEDGWFADVDGGYFFVSGRPALEFIFTNEFNAQVTLLPGTTMASTVSGTQVDGKIEYTDDDVVAAGVSRYLQPFVAQVTDDGLISSLYLTYDTSDAETAEWLAYLEALPDEEPPPGTIEVAIGPGRDGSQPGSAFLTPAEDGLTFVYLVIAPGPAGVQQPAHIHAGTCETQGGIAYELAPVIDGASFSLISADLDDLLAGEFNINVHMSEAEFDVYVACGDVEAVVAAPVALPDTGYGSVGGSGAPALLLALFATIGLAAVSGGLLRARRA